MSTSRNENNERVSPLFPPHQRKFHVHTDIMDSADSKRAQKPSISSNSGVALVLVLACIVLLVAVAIAFMAGMGNEMVSSKSYSQQTSVRIIADSAVDVVKSQILQATSASGTMTWASQPGAIRTFDNSGRTGFVYKLYSSGTMIQSGAVYNSGSSAGTVTDLPSNPATAASQSNVYADLNEPVLAGTGTTAALVYPIVDPTSLLASSGTSTSILGFSVTSGTTQTNISGTSAVVLPMPAQWLYVLQSGSLVAPIITGSSNVVTVPGASADNPIVGRVAFWTDDETCKLNINTASETREMDPSGTTSGHTSFWDIPRAGTPFEYSLVGYSSGTGGQPAQNEFQRYPGHPARLSLGTVFWSGSMSSGSFPVSSLTADQIYSMTPRTNSDHLVSSGSNLGSNGGTQDSAGPLPLKTDRLYTSLDEFMFAPTVISGTRTASLSGTIFNPSLNQARFFLTAYNRAPELNLFGTPRISMWPISSDTNKWTTTDGVFAFCSTIGTGANNKFYVTRSNPNSPTYDSTPGNTTIPDMFTYLQNLTGGSGAGGITIPGFGGNFYSKYPGTPPEVTRDQILTLMLDYVRCVNIYDTSVSTGTIAGTTYASNLNAFATGSNSGFPGSYAAGGGNSGVLNWPGYGQVVPLQITSSGTTYKGLGRFNTTISEAAIQFYALTWDSGTAVRYQEVPNPGTTGPLSGTYRTFVTGTSGAKNPPLYKATLLLNPFNPMLGYPACNPNYKYVVTGLTGGFQAITMATTSGTTATSGTWPLFAWNTGTDSVIVPGSYSGAVLGGNTPGWEILESCGTFYPKATQNTGTANGASDYPFGVPMINTGTTVTNISGNGNPMNGFPIDQGQTSFQFTGGTITVNVEDSGGDVLQTLNITFPDITASNGVAIPQPIPYLTGTQTTATAIGGGVLTFRDRVAGAGRGDALMGGDVVIGVEANGNATDFRWLSLQPNVPGTYFKEHQNYYVTKSGSAFYKACGLRAGTSYANDAVSQGSSSGTISYAHPMPGYGSASSGIIAAFTGAVSGTAVSPKPTISSRYGTSGTYVSLDMAGGGALGDWDTGFGDVPDGAYANMPDGGQYRLLNINSDFPYYLNNYSSQYGLTYQTYFMPGRQVPSPGMFGSLPVGPWHTLLFNPNPAADIAGTPNHGGFGTPSNGNAVFGTAANGPPFTVPPDYLLMDLFWMPVVQPYPISEPFSTAGKVNMNYQIVPFTYIRRNTALRAVLAANRITAFQSGVGANNAPNYKGNPGAGTTFRYPIQADWTLANFQANFDQNQIFRSASQICSVSLYPMPGAVPGGSGYTFGGPPASGPFKVTQWYVQNVPLTGDNLREQPYTAMYENLTTQSNTYTVHVRAQTIKASSANPSQVTAVTPVTGEYRGSYLIERYIDPNDPRLSSISPTTGISALSQQISQAYKFRTISSKQFVP